MRDHVFKWSKSLHNFIEYGYGNEDGHDFTECLSEFILLDFLCSFVVFVSSIMCLLRPYFIDVEKNAYFIA